MISHIDHLVLTVANIEASVKFYKRVLNLREETFAGGRRSVNFGTQKINLQTLGMELRNHAATGSGDLCLVTEWALDQVIVHLKQQKVELIEGPVQKVGAQGPMMSVYFNDPDGNLIEISSYN